MFRPSTSPGWIRRALAGAVVFASLGLTWIVPARALETDQYISWGRPLADSTSALNAWFNLRLQEVLDESQQGGRIPTRWQIERRYAGKIRFWFILHPPELWACSSSLVARFPNTAAEEEQFRRTNVYHVHGPLDIGLWMPLAPTIVVNGVRIGTDKLSHFVSLGWQLYESYRHLVHHGVPPAQATLRALRGGFDGERYYLLGYRTSGILSLSDLESDYEGMLFYRDLCGGDDPVLERTGHGWRVRRPIDLARYVTPEWDESYEPQIFRPGRWKKVKPVLRQYCSWLDNPWLIAQRRRYARRDHLTVVEKLIEEYVAEGKLPPPGQFTLEAVCGRPLRSLDPAGQVSRRSGKTRTRPDETVPSRAERRLEARIIEESRHPLVRWAGLWRAGLAGPLGPSAAIGTMRGRFPSGTPCHLLCSFRGPYAEVAAGPGGMSLSFGYGRIWGDLTRRGHVVRHAYMGMGLRGTLLRTWNGLGGAPPGATYAGPEIEFSVAKLNLFLGGLRRLDGRHAGDWLVTWGLGFGF